VSPVKVIAIGIKTFNCKTCPWLLDHSLLNVLIPGFTWFKMQCS